MTQTGSQVLIFYSNPSDTTRLRLDKEHRAVDQVLQRLNLDANLVHRLHAATVEDFAVTLRERSCEIVQFSGHGSTDGIYLENSKLGISTVISAKQIATLLQDKALNLKAAIFVSCFSSSFVPDLIDIAPYIITMTGEADDEVAIQFISTFYEEFFRHRSIERAFASAQRYVKFTENDPNLNTTLSRRAAEKQANRVLFQVFPHSYRYDSILIDLTEAEADIEKLGVSRDTFLTLLSRKIRLHVWIFDSPRERAILSIGPYFGIFSWQNANDLVVCHKIMKVKPEVDEETCEVWARLIVAYNDCCAAPYRTAARPADPSMAKSLEVSMWEYGTFYKFIGGERGAEREEKMKTWGEREEEMKREAERRMERARAILRSVAPEQYKVTASLFSANMKMCEEKFNEGDYVRTVMYLEASLSAIHDLVEAVTAELVE